MKFWTAYDKFWDNCERNMFLSLEKDAKTPRWRFYLYWGVLLTAANLFGNLMDSIFWSGSDDSFTLKDLLLKVPGWLLWGFGGAVLVRFIAMRDYKYFLRKGWKSEKDDETTA